MNFLFYAPQMAPYGGMERHICTLAAALARENHRIRILTTSDSLGAELRGLLKQPGIELRELGAVRGSAGPLRKLTWLLTQVFLARATHWDLIYTNGQSGLARQVWRAARPGCRILHHHHTAADHLEQATWAPSFRQVLSSAPELVGCSETTCANIRAATKRTQSLFLPYLTRCILPSDAVRERVAGETVRLGFLGRLVREKGIDIILELAREGGLADIEWHIHGAGDAFPPSHFEGIPSLHYHGAYHSLEEHVAALNGLDAVALFSTHNEGMPLSLIEAMSAGLPWIATDKGGTRELALSPSEAVVCPPGLKAREYAPLVQELADSIRMGRTSRKRQRQAYDTLLHPEVVARRWIAHLTLPQAQTNTER